MTTQWEQLTWIGHDSFLAIADAAVPAAVQVEALRATNMEYRLIDATKSGISVVAAFTEAVEDVPVEVRRDDHGAVVSLRLCWTNDVGERGCRARAKLEVDVAGVEVNGGVDVVDHVADADQFFGHIQVTS